MAALVIFSALGAWVLHSTDGAGLVRDGKSDDLD
jgi:hypothetical protein